MQTTELPAGRELDALIAERVMGLTLDWTHSEIRAIVPGRTYANDRRGIYCRCPGCGLAGYGNEVDWVQRCPTPVCPPYSTDIAAAWEIVTQLLAQNYRLELYSPGHQAEGEIYWTCNFVRDGYTQGWARETTEQLAICRAALAAVGYDPNSSTRRNPNANGQT